MTTSKPSNSGDVRNSKGSLADLSLGKAIHIGMFWNFIGFVAMQSSAFLIFIILAIKLPPEIFGVVALAAVAADVIGMDGRYACMDAVIQAGKFDKRTLNTSFASFLMVAIAVCVAMMVASRYIGSIEGYELVGLFLPLFGLMILPIPWLAVMDAIIMRDLGFKQLTQRSILGTVVGGAAGIAVAFSPYLIWALVVQRIVALVVTTLFEFNYTRWTPGIDIDHKGVKSFLKRFFPLWAIASLNQAAPRITMVVFGSRYDTATVGLLRAANRIGDTLQGPLVNPMMGLWFPLMAKVRGDKQGESEIYTSIIRTAAFLSLPTFAGLALVSQDVAHVLLPDSYSGVGPLLRAISIISLMIPIAWFNAIVMSALELNKQSLIFTVCTVLLSVGTLLAIPNSSAANAIIIMSVPTWIFAFVGHAIIHRRLELSSLRHYKSLFPAMLATLAMSACVWTLYLIAASWFPLTRLIVAILCGAIVYIGWLLVFHRQWFMSNLTLIRGKA